MSVRQSVATVVVIAFEKQSNVSSQKTHRVGSLMILSRTLSMPSHCFKILVWIRSSHINAMMKLVELIEPIIGKKLAL